MGIDQCSSGDCPLTLALSQRARELYVLHVDTVPDYGCGLAPSPCGNTHDGYDLFGERVGVRGGGFRAAGKKCYKSKK
jgi:hypothetical protein